MIIQHRVNSIRELEAVPFKYGVEVDLRSSGSEIICAHDPFLEAEKFSDWIRAFNHRGLIANIKSEGIEKEVLKIISDNKIKNFFLLDVTFPMIYQLHEFPVNNFAYRVSDLESFNLHGFSKVKCSWIWLDAFERFPLNQYQNIIQANLPNIKICLVSPELHTNRNKNTSERIFKEIKSLGYNFDAICTKDPLLWQ